MAVAGRKISAASARAHTRKSKQKSSFKLPSGMFKTLSLVLLVGFLAWAYQVIQPPPPEVCGSPSGPPVTAPRIKLKDGRHLAYKEYGVPKENAKYKIVFVHGFGSCRHDASFMSQEFAEELGIYLVSFDRAGYGESDPNPSRTVKSSVLDVEELADQLGLGSKFYLIGYSMGGQVVWSALKYIPHRLLGATLLTPVVNYWWPGFPANLSKEVYNQQFTRDQWAVRVAHYTPWLTYWWNTQKWFPASSVASDNLEIISQPDRAILPKIAAKRTYLAQITQQGKFESLHRDMIVGFGKWEFDPMDLENPFPNNEGSVHLWQGDQDLLVPITLQRYIAEKLPWIQYHELKDTGHFFPYAEGLGEAFLRAFLPEK
ncbi:Alpha/beta-Hydrolases superfamily protein [Thalictrum thalictroides]|uniref:Alpha/beta-Hydrolases superfamily protein n=2 Tax=Thalictrum thalictroides TaxID=46969 RepID=A0A7J6VY63_THATH|nr:Alpha/beta-Hydrolases superfamily protein [Thalictrum thalictroides]